MRFNLILIVCVLSFISSLHAASFYTPAAFDLLDSTSTSKYVCGGTGTGNKQGTVSVQASPWTVLYVESDWVADGSVNASVATLDWNGYQSDFLSIACPQGYAVPAGLYSYAWCDNRAGGWYVSTTATGPWVTKPAVSSFVLSACQPVAATNSFTTAASPATTQLTATVLGTLNSYLTANTAYTGRHNEEVTVNCGSGLLRSGRSTARCDNTRISPAWNTAATYTFPKCNTLTDSRYCRTQLELLPGTVASTTLYTKGSGNTLSIGTTITGSNGFYTGYQGDVIKVVCAAGCQSQGSSTTMYATCNNNVGWDSRPVCVPAACDDSVPVTPAGTGVVRITATNAPQEEIGAADPPPTFVGYVGDSVSVTCNAGYYPQSGVPQTASCVAATNPTRNTWGTGAQLAQCLPYPCATTPGGSTASKVTIPSLLTGVTTLLSTFWTASDAGSILGTPTQITQTSQYQGRVGDIVGLRCNAGLTLVGAASATCGANGWSTLGSCVLVCPGTLNAPVNGYLTQNQYANVQSPTKYASIVNPTPNENQYYAGCNTAGNLPGGDSQYGPTSPIQFPTTYPGGNAAYARGVTWNFGTALYDTYPTSSTTFLATSSTKLNPATGVGVAQPLNNVGSGGVSFPDSTTPTGTTPIYIQAWGFTSYTGSGQVLQTVATYAPGPVPASGPLSKTWNTPSGTFTSSPGPARLVPIALKNQGGGETGLGLAGDSQFEISWNQWVTFNLLPLRQAGFSAINFGISSVQDGEGYSIWGSNTLGSPGQLLYVGTAELGVTSQYIVADDVPSAAAPYQYISIATQPKVQGTQSNVLVNPITARGVTTCTVPTLPPCGSPTGPSTIRGDPQFSGLQGQNFQFHGIPDEVFSLITTPSLQMNSHFKYISAGTCTYKETQCWTHPGTYLDEVGFLIGSGVRVHVVSGAHEHGLRVFIDGEEKFAEPGLNIDISEEANVTTAVVQYMKHNTVTILTDLFDIELVNSDYFFNLGVVLKNRHIVTAGRPRHVVPSGVCKAEHQARTSHKESHSHENSPVRHDLLHHYPDLPIHGLVGQTWRNAIYCGNQYEGSVDDYVVGSLWGTDFTFNQYTLDADRLIPQSEREEDAQLHHI